MSSKKLKVMIADDFELIREGIRNLLELDGSIRVVAEAKDGVECLTILEKMKPDILLLDINMPLKNGLDVLYEIRKKSIPVKVLMLTVYNETDYLLKAIEIGADGYVTKNIKFDELKNAIDTLANGENFIQKDLIPLLNEKIKNKTIENEKLESLTNRELDVLKCIASGHSNKEIASNLEISERTVKNHISNIFKKICVSDRTQAAVFAIRNNLVSI